MWVENDLQVTAFCFIELKAGLWQLGPWWFLRARISLPPESLVVDAFVVEVVVLEIQLSEVSQVVKSPSWDFLQLVILLKKKQKKHVQSLCYHLFYYIHPANIWIANLTGAGP